MIQYKSKNVTIFESALYQTTSSVIDTKDMILIVDPTWLPKEIEDIKLHVNGIRDHRPIYLAFTHSDYDHILGYNAFAKAITIGSKELNERCDKDNIIEQIKSFDDEYYIVRDYEIQYPSIDILVHRDGEKLQIGETTLIFYKSPGHTSDGIFIVIEPLGILIVGDYLSNLEFPYIYHNSREYENTLLKIDKILKEHKIKLLIPGHGLITESHEEIKRRQEESLNYIRKLRNAIIKNSKEEIDKIIEGCLFPRFMRKYHYDNQKIIKKELGI